MEKIMQLVELTKAKVDILKLKADEYTWACHISDSTKEKLEKTLIEIDDIIHKL